MGVSESYKLWLVYLISHTDAIDHGQSWHNFFDSFFIVFGVEFPLNDIRYEMSAGTGRSVNGYQLLHKRCVNGVPTVYIKETSTCKKAILFNTEGAFFPSEDELTELDRDRNTLKVLLNSNSQVVFNAGSALMWGL